jgi:EAL domain-containing protein (putative c-di-GMP-specific phosphodiesterase class I)
MKGFIKEVKRYGCKIAIDDFGSGYSNFSHIFELNVDYLKIDGSLVKFITTDESSRVIVKTIVNFASNLGLKTIAEFVEDRDSLELLEKMGVDFIQGYYIGKPSSDLCEDFR